MKRILSLVLAFVFVMGICASAPMTITANAANLVNGDFEYRLINNDTEVEITGYVGSGGDVYIPNQISGKNVTSIGSSAFEGNTTITYVWMSDFVTKISDYAFQNCTGLKNIDFGSGLKELGDDVFTNCTSLVEITLPDSLEKMMAYCNASYTSEGMFSNCTSLKRVVIGNGLKEIPYATFYGCKNLETVVFGNNIEKIDRSAFNSCVSLESVNLPDSLLIIESYAFRDCTGLKNIDFGSGLKELGDDVFTNCTSLVEITLPDSLEKMTAYCNASYTSEGMFSNCTSLKKVVIGNGLKEIPYATFYGCKNLETIVFGENIQSDFTDGNIEGIDYNVFDGCTSLKNVYFLSETAPSIDESNTELKSATWHYLPNASGFTQGSVSKTYKTVTFDGNGGSTLINDVPTASYTKYADNGRVSTPINPTREGYTFLGWYLTKDGTGEKVNFNTYNVTANTTFYAKWQINTYRIYFDPRGGSVSLGGKDVVYGQQIGTLPTPTLKGDTFNGWYLGMNSSGPCYTATTKMPAKDIILYAGWATNDNATTVIFDTEGGSFIAPVTAATMEKIQKPQMPVKKNYIFIGWYKDDNHSEKFDFSSEMIEGNTIVYAGWRYNPASLNCKHTTSDWIIDTQANCSISGFKYKKCVLCSEILQTENTPIIGHNAVNVGSKDIHSKCGTCGTVISSTHSFTKSVVKAATCTQEGSNKYTCSCGYSYTENVAVLGHNYSKDFTVDKQPTYKEAGSKSRHCTRCSAKTDVTAIPKLVLGVPAVAQKNTAKGITLSWSAIKDAESYIVYRRTYNESTKKYSGWTILNKAYTGTSYTDTTVKLGTIYSYTVKAANEDATSSYTATKKFKYDVTPTVKVAVASNGIKVSWSTAANATGYTVYSSTYNTKTKKWSGWTNRGTTKANATSWVDKKAKSGTKYRYTVKAMNDKVGSTYNKDGAATLYLAQPTVKIANASTGVKVSWSKVTGATGYTVYRSEYKNGAWTKWASRGTAKANKTSWTDTKVASGVQYKYTVRAINGKVASTYVSSNTVLYLAQPKATVKAVSNGINVAWTQSTGATGYTVYRMEYNTKTKKWSSWKKMGTAKSSKTNWTDKSAKKGVQYKYTVKAVNGKAASTYKASGSVKR